LNHLKQFQANWDRVMLFSNIDLDFYEMYFNSLKSINLNQNSIGKELKNIKTFLNEAAAQNEINGSNYQINRAYKTKEFKNKYPGRSNRVICRPK